MAFGLKCSLQLFNFQKNDTNRKIDQGIQDR
jgi:hypothetical protein